MSLSKFALLVLSCTLGFMNLAQAEFAPETPSVNRRTRNLGMGNVGVALEGTADSSPFYNPAGLNDLKKSRYQFLSPHVELSKGSIQQLENLSDLVDDLDQAQDTVDRLDVLDSFVREHAGEFYRARFALDLFNYTRKNLAAGVAFDARIYSSFRNPAFVNFEFQNLGDLAMFVAGSYSFWDKLLQVGLTLRPTIRFALDQGDQVITLDDVATDNESGEPILFDQLRKLKDPRFGIGVDVGLKSTLGFKGIRDQRWFKNLRPSLGFVWRDIGNTGFSGAVSNPQSLGVGIAAQPACLGWPVVLGLDFVDLNQDRPILTMLHFGVEVETPWWITLRGGVNQGYPAAGLSVKLWFANLQAAFFGQEIGTHTREKANYITSLSLSFQI